MSTRSYIGITNADSSVDAIYCHYDGYPEYNGDMLIKHYNDENKVKELISLGDISSLREKVAPEPNSKHSFSTPDEDVTIAYMRDRGETGCETSHFTDEDDFEKSVTDGFTEYIYLFKDNKWYMKDQSINMSWQLVESRV